MRVACFFLILASGAWALPITLLKPLYPLLPLVRDGQPQATLVAPRADYAPAALLNARLTQAGGVALPVEVAGRGAWTRWPAASQSTRPHLVALGNINDNELLAVLWSPHSISILDLGRKSGPQKHRAWQVSCVETSLRVCSAISTICWGTYGHLTKLRWSD